MTLHFPRNWPTSQKLMHTIFCALTILLYTMFAIWWFTPEHLPHNFAMLGALDVLLFLLVSYVIWHPLFMDILTMAVSSHIKDIPEAMPPAGLRVAFITTIVPSSEPLTLLDKCLPAMVRAEYPHDTWLLDEGNDPRVQELCRRYGVKYFSRSGKKEYNTPAGKFTKTKGGNHNSWYVEYGNDYDIVAQIDTDFVPSLQFLTKTLGYFRDPKVAFVGTPQIYGNVDESLIARGAAEQQYSFYGTVLRGLSGMGMTLLIGANHVIRVAALKEVDHYSAHITEDLLTGMKLHTRGYKSVYLPYPLAIGEGPTTWESYFNQQMRWAYGCIDILFHHSPTLFRKMDLRKKIYYFFLQQHYFSGIAMAISILLLGIYFLLGFQAANVDLFTFFLFYSVIQLVSWMMSVWQQRYHIRLGDGGKLLIAGIVINIAVWPIWFLAFLSVLRKKRLTYKVTPKGDNDTDEKISISVFTPHLILASIAALGLMSSFLTHRQNPSMVFWAFSSMSILLYMPWVTTTQKALAKTYAHASEIVHKVFDSHIHLSLISEPMPATVSSSSRIVALPPERKKRGVAQDMLFLSLVVLSSFAFYVRKMGFYSDDWSFLANFHFGTNHSLWGLIQTATTPNTFMRPVQNVLDASLYWLFGTNPLGYHVFNAALYVGIVLVFYHVLRRLQLPRVITLALPLVYILLPQYSTDRFWFASFQANVSMLFYFISLYTGLAGCAVSSTKSMFWKTISLLTLVFSALSYEVAIPLFFFNIILFWNPFEKIAKKYTHIREDRSVFMVLTFISLLYILLFKAKTTTRLVNGASADILTHVIQKTQMMFSAIQVNYFTLGIELPVTIWQFVRQYSDPVILATSIVLGVGIYFYLSGVFSEMTSRLPSGFFMRLFLLSSLVTFLLGYAIFLTNDNVAFSPTGVANRVAIAAAIGVASTLVALTGWFCSLLRSRFLASQVFSALIALICVVGLVMINTLSIFWIQAYQKQQIVVADIVTHVSSLSPESTIILDGICPYIGPATVFESNWDLKGALQLAYNDPTIQADIVTARLQVDTDGIHSHIYNLSQTYPFYPYGKLFIYNFETKTVYPITDVETAQYYFTVTNPGYKTACPTSQEGNGVDVLN